MMNFHFDFFKKRFLYIGFSALLIIVGFIGMFVNKGLNLDIQFEGGTHLEIPMKTSGFNTGDIEGYIRDTYGKVVTAQRQQVFSIDAQGDENTHLIIKASKSETFSAEQINELQVYLDESYGLAQDQRVSIKTVEPYIGADMMRKGLLAVLIASILILLYVWIRFSVMSGLAAALCATIGLVNAILITLAFYAVFRFPINDSFIAAILTILGYSINNTIVVYDRIRENAKSAKKLSYPDLVNSSINQTLTRTLNTTITTLISVVTVFVFSLIFRINSLTDFCLPLIIGISAGVYTTLFIASQCWAMWQMNSQSRQIAASKR